MPRSFRPPSPAKSPGQLQPRLSGNERESLAKAGTTNAEAYQLYLKGRYHEEKYTRADVNTGIDEFRRAIQLDPNYAAAYAGLAYSYVIANDFFLSPNDSMPPSREAAKKALQLDESNPEAHMALAWIKWGYDYDSAGGEAELKRAIELAPRDGAVHWPYGYFLVLDGKPDAGIEEGKRAVALDPASLETNTFLGGDLYYGHRYDEAAKQLRATVDMEPNYWISLMMLGMTYEQLGDLPHALDEIEKATRALAKNLRRGSPRMKTGGDQSEKDNKKRAHRDTKKTKPSRLWKKPTPTVPCS
jgi:Tfp pilus assembly protein PilF